MINHNIKDVNIQTDFLIQGEHFWVPRLHMVRPDPGGQQGWVDVECCWEEYSKGTVVGTWWWCAAEEEASEESKIRSSWMVTPISKTSWRW